MEYGRRGLMDGGHLGYMGEWWRGQYYMVPRHWAEVRAVGCEKVGER